MTCFILKKSWYLSMPPVFETYIAHDFSNPERRLFPMRPSGENLIYLNKLAEMTYKFSSLVPNAKREKTPDRFVHRGGKGSR